MYDTLELDSSTCSEISVQSPQATSSLKPNMINHKSKPANKKTIQRLTILYINCQSVKSKVHELHQVIH